MASVAIFIFVLFVDVRKRLQSFIVEKFACGFGWSQNDGICDGERDELKYITLPNCV